MEKWKEVTLLFIALLLAIQTTGCIGETGQPKTTTTTTTSTLPVEEPMILDIIPTILYNPLEGYTGDAGEAFLVLPGDQAEVQQKLKQIITQGEQAPENFKSDEKLNLVIFRGVFRTGGYSIKIEKVARNGNEYTVEAVYHDPEPGGMVIQAFTQPTAIIPIGENPAGEYQATLIIEGGKRAETGFTIS